MERAWNRIIFILAGLAGLSALSAQGFLPLEEAVRRALSADAVRQADALEIGRSAIRKEQLRRQYLPQASLQADLRVNAARPTTILPAGISGDEEKAVQFGTVFSQQAWLDIQQFIFEPTLRASLRKAEVQEQADQVRATLRDEDLRLQAVSLYRQVQVNRSQLERQELVLRRLDENREKARVRVEARLADPIDLDRAASLYERGQLEQKKIQSAEQYALQALNFLMGDTSATQWRLEPAPDSLALVAEAVALLQDGPRWVESPQMQWRRLQEQLAWQDREALLAASLPSLSAYGYAGLQAFGNTFNPFDAQRMPWYPAVYLGLRAAWSLNAFADRRRDLPLYEAQVRQSRLLSAREREDLRLAWEQAREQVRSAVLDLQLSRNARKLARREMEYARTRWMQGLADGREMTRTERELSEAELQTDESLYRLAIAVQTLRKTLKQ